MLRFAILLTALLWLPSAVPTAAQHAKPTATALITKWGEQLDPGNVYTEYPRPQMARDQWQNLNGKWDYAVTSADQRAAPTNWDGEIVVPFCLESKLGGVERLLQPNEALWYHRTLQLDNADQGMHTLLNFEAVDYQCEVLINGKSVGKHRGGNTPFSFDITDAAKLGANELVVRVEDDTQAFQLNGKQKLDPKGIWYTRVSGIWQSVWVEQVNGAHLEDLKISTNPSKGTITVKPIVAGADNAMQVKVRVLDGGKPVADARQKLGEVTIEVPDAKLWSPDSPHLYDLKVELVTDDGKVVDSVESYAGIRSVGKQQNEAGDWVMTLNGKEIFHWGPLDQGWWPDGLLTPPSEEAMLFDIEFLKQAGFNMIRKHIKVEPRRYYYHCDRLGMMVWQDQVSGGPKPEWTRLQPNPEDAKWPAEQHEQFMQELEWMISELESHPSIVIWTPFNEAWGQHQTVEVGKWVAKRDPSRLVNIVSGGNFWPAGDIVDAHKYPHPDFPFAQGEGGRFEDYIKVVGEFGGHGYPVEGHLWDREKRNWGYGGLPKNEEEFLERYETSIEKLNELRSRGIAAGVYTQTTDVEGEINGLITYDRKVIKIPAERLAKLHEKLFEDKPQITQREAPKPMTAAQIRSGLESHDKALFVKTGWIRDPYIVIGPDDHYYLTGTQPNPGNPCEAADRYNVGLGGESIVGKHVRVWRSRDLVDWEYRGEPFSLDDSLRVQNMNRKPRQRLIWAPEVHWLGDRWALVHCPQRVASLAVTKGEDLKGPWTHPMQGKLGNKHDPSLFQDDDGTIYLLWANTMIAPLKDDLSDFAGQAVRIDPAGSRPGPDGKPISRIGHEGATLRKIGDKYVHFGTAWSTDQGRKGSYNLYYCTTDKPTGPYGPRRFAGRFLGHGTPFQDRDGQWWCTAFFNGNVPPVSREGIQERDLGDDAQTINEQGVTLVPLDVEIDEAGEVHIRAVDPDYASPGPDEVQQFDPTA